MRRNDMFGRLLGKNDDGGSANPDPTMKDIPGKPAGENMPPAGGSSMAPADSKRPHAEPDDQAADADSASRAIDRKA